MIYERMEQAVFLNRPNRFIAQIRIGEQELLCHVKNTGRCKELLVSGAKILVQWATDPKRKTPCDLIAVWKQGRLINMDSQIPNKVFGEWAAQSGLFPGLSLLKAETIYGSSRFDFYAEYGSQKAFIEVKGVTLEENGRVLFPDAPTERGLKHVRELMACTEKGYAGFVIFVIQMDRVSSFSPNRRTHAAFADALVQAEKKGVTLRAISCAVTPNSICAEKFVPIIL